MDFFKLPT